MLAELFVWGKKISLGQSAEIKTPPEVCPGPRHVENP